MDSRADMAGSKGAMSSSKAAMTSSKVDTGVSRGDTVISSKEATVRLAELNLIARTVRVELVDTVEACRRVSRHSVIQEAL